VVSIAGDRFNYLALVALADRASPRARVTAPRAVLAALAWAMLAPALVLSPWAGAIVDRLPLVRVLVWTDLLRALVVARFPFAYHARAARHAIVYALIALALRAELLLPARALGAARPTSCPRPSLAWANALLVLGGVLATLVGTALGGPLVDRFGPRAGAVARRRDVPRVGRCLATLLFQGVDGRVPRAPHEARHPLREARAGWLLLSRSIRGASAGGRVGHETWVAGGVPPDVAGTAATF
jgi:hypothetical protein